MTEQNIYLSKTPRDLENLLVYYKSNMRQTEKTISLIEEAIAATAQATATALVHRIAAGG